MPGDGADHIDGASIVKPQLAFPIRVLMHIRTRKLIGSLALLALVVIWAFLAMAFAQFALGSANGLVVMAFYVIAGLGWVLPAMPLVSWMVRPDKPAKSSS